MKRVLSFVVLSFVLIAFQAGCETFSFIGDIGDFNRTAGPIQLKSEVAEGYVITGNFEHRFYSYESKDHVDIYLVDGDLADPKQAIHIRMFWEPKVGLTQVDSEAINAKMDYIVFAGDEIGIYGGGGLFFPTRWSDPANASFSGTMQEISVAFIDGSKNFKDLLGNATATGSVVAENNEKKAIQLRTQINILIDQRLKKPRYVKADEAKAIASLMK